MYKSQEGFNVFERGEKVKQARDQVWDLIVIGGGITGCGIALDAVSRGIKTLLIEKTDFAAGTSSKSTKLIHGGLRYLKQLEIGLVKETGTERAIVHQLAPNLVHPEKMLLPIVKKGTFGKLSASLAITVYDFLASVESKDKKQSLTKSKVIQDEPLLRPNLVTSGIKYSEYRTDDARLTIELIKTAVQHGATAFNYLSCKDFIYNNDKVVGVVCQDHLTDSEVEFESKHVVSAAGPWVDKLRTLDQSVKGKSLHLTKGVHIVIPQEKLPLEQAVYFDVFDGRMVFAIPRGKVTYVGTSDTTYHYDLDRVLCSQNDVDYLIGALNRMFDLGEPLTPNDVISTWAGLRPLIHEDGKSPSELSRKDEIFESESGLISIAGGKLTGYRKMAQRIVDLIQKNDADISQKPCITKTLNLHENQYKDYDEVLDEIKSLQVSNHDLSHYDAWYIITTYGKNSWLILSKWQDLRSQGLSPNDALIQSELWYGLQYESVARPDDFFIRRTGRLYFDIESVEQYKSFIIDEMSETLAWNSKIKDEVHKISEQLIMDCTIFRTPDLVDV